jgi:small subunit ribosomal protein S27e
MVIAKRLNRSRFVKVKCPDCENEQLIFEKASSTVSCVVCNHVLANPTGGKAEIKADIIAAFE